MENHNDEIYYIIKNVLIMKEFAKSIRPGAVIFIASIGSFVFPPFAAILIPGAIILLLIKLFYG
ncbi:MAG: hypothetical protein K8F60_12695 [Melioribacteraceae bacterium]|nr:hypothetical protein [Melioribacteraceae bacterium]